MTGYGVIVKTGSAMTYVSSGCIKSAVGELPDRIKTIFSGVSEVILRFVPGEVAVEKVFVNVNPQSTLLLGQARGAAISAAVSAISPWPNTPRYKSSKPWSARAREKAGAGNGQAIAEIARLSEPRCGGCIGLRHLSCAWGQMGDDDTRVSG